MATRPYDGESTSSPVGGVGAQGFADATSAAADSAPPQLSPRAPPKLARMDAPTRTPELQQHVRPSPSAAQPAFNGHGASNGQAGGPVASSSFAAPRPPISAEVRAQTMAWHPTLSHPLVEALLGELTEGLQRPRSPGQGDGRKRSADHFDAMGGQVGVDHGGMGMVSASYPRKRVCRLLNIVVRRPLASLALTRFETAQLPADGRPDADARADAATGAAQAAAAGAAAANDDRPVLRPARRLRLHDVAALRPAEAALRADAAGARARVDRRDERSSRGHDAPARAARPRPSAVATPHCESSFLGPLSTWRA